MTPDLHPAAEQMVDLLTGVDDVALHAPTPCGSTVAALASHVGGLALAFTAAARKDLGPLTTSRPEIVEDLPDGWREVFPDRVRALADAWADPAAWEGRTQAGGLDMSAAEAGVVALDELVLHGWDLAVSTGRAYDCDPATVEVVHGFVAAVPDDPAARGGLFGPVVPVAADAPAFDRVLGLAGRDPRWTPAG